jgi:hypothetical protein
MLDRDDDPIRRFVHAEVQIAAFVAHLIVQLLQGVRDVFAHFLKVNFHRWCWVFGFNSVNA